MPTRLPISLFILVFFCLSHISCRQPTSRLANSTSPYLRLHADNPVDWYGWGDEALAKAKKENKPLLISIGFASCHWCHVMEKESFMDTAVARMMNENFVCIKVDREQRPDIDQVYMNACQLISGNAGWPLNAFAMPDGRPFYAGTFFSNQNWMSLLKQVSTAFRTQPGKVALQAASLTNGIAKLELELLTGDVDSFGNVNSSSNVNSPGNVDSTNDVDSTGIVVSSGFRVKRYAALLDSLFKRLDPVNGGLRGNQKFPMPALLELLLQHAAICGDTIALNFATNTLTKMALGGIYDQAGGGFARYAVDSLWHLPHFEKMLYDNAQLISVYAHAYQLTGNNFYKSILQETIAFVNSELGAGNGGYFSSLNADTKAGEGAYYTWTYNELKKITGDAIFCDYFGVKPGGNFIKDDNDRGDNDKGGNNKGDNVLHAASTPSTFANDKKMNTADFISRLKSARLDILRIRKQREAPALDHKILASWNALMLTALADAYVALQDKAILAQANSTAAFIEQNFLKTDGSVLRNYTGSSASIAALLEDYAMIAKAYIRLYQVTFNKKWLNTAQKLSDYAIKHFYDSKTGMFYNTSAAGQHAVVRKMSLVDESMPSANAVMAGVLHQLGLYSDREDYLSMSSAMLTKTGKEVSRSVPYMAHWAGLIGLQVYGTNEIVITGKDAMARNVEMQRNYLPQNLYLGSIDEENLPLMVGKFIKGKTYIYACVKKTCKRPVETVSEAIKQMVQKR